MFTLLIISKIKNRYVDAPKKRIEKKAISFK